MHHFRIIVFNFIVISLPFVIKSVGSVSKNSEQCPTMCFCDAHMNYNRANCSNEKLINANIGMSSYVEILDLSNNDITALDNECFSELKYLTILSLENNAIEYIVMDAFVSLKNLQNIILANNRLETFDKNIFEQNTKLTNVNLSGNKFMNLNNVPILKSASVQMLAMQSSKLSHLHIRIFEELPNLKTIDLSDNLLITLNIVAFAHNQKLRNLNVERNPLACDAQLELSLVWLKRIRIKVKSRMCPQASNPSPTPVRMFERMEMMPTSSSKPAKANQMLVTTEIPAINDLTKVWKMKHNVKILNEICPLNDTDRACDLFEACVSNLTVILKEIEHKLLRPKHAEYEMTPHKAWMQFVTVNIAFYAGLILGAVFGGCFIYISNVIIARCFAKKRVNDEYFRPSQVRNRAQRNCSRQIAVPAAERINRPTPNRLSSTTSAASSQPYRAPALRDHDVVRYNDDNERHRYPPNSIFALLFERPVRRRYYRQLNRSATNLVRRLSQSRLFLNSSRSQNAQYRNSYVSNRNNSQRAGEPELDNSSLIEAITAHQQDVLMQQGNSTGTLTRSASMPSVNVENDVSVNDSDDHMEMTYSSEPEPESDERAKAETPPPAYLDIVKDIRERNTFDK